MEQKNRSRARVKLAVFFVLSVHVIGLMALLMQGCRKPPEPEVLTDTNLVSTVDTNFPAATDTNVLAPAVVDTTTPVVTPEPPPVAPAQEYVVAKGDSFYTIAKQFGVSMKAVQDANPGVDPKKLQIGQKLQIPAPSASGTPTAPGVLSVTDATSAAVYTVKSGDTLTKIAADHGTTVKALRSENSLTTDKIKVGQKLNIPVKAAAPVETAPAPVNPPVASPTGQ